jgi:uncharacterized protein (DUF4213/DUF364 family)
MDDVDLMQERADAISTTVEFLFGEITEQDDQTIRAMIVLGGSDDQIVRSLGIAAVNTRVGREDKARYAYGCLRNIMMEDANLPIEQDFDEEPDIEAHGGFEY